MNTPTLFTCVGYRLVYGNQEFDAQSTLAGLPLYDAINYVIERQNLVQYSLGSDKDQMRLIDELLNYLRYTPKYRLKLAKQKYKNLYLFCNMATLPFIMMAIEYCDNSSRALNNAEIERVYKAYLYCNDYWSDLQANGIKQLVLDHSFQRMSLMADIPIMEFKFHKDFKSQLFKAGQLFLFMESQEPYATYLQMFCKELRINNWKEYISLLFSFYSSIIDRCIVIIEDKYDKVRPFFNQMCIDLTHSDVKTLWSTKNLKYLREHPLLRVKNEFYIALNPNLVIDRIYQALKFVIFNAMLSNGATNIKGKLITDRPTFFGMLGTDFSESRIFYIGIEKAFTGPANALFSGAKLKQNKIPAESDYYVRIGEYLLLFEYKDVLLSDDVKQSYDYITIKNAILERLCKDDGKTRKGVGQLLFSANEILNNQSMSVLDPDSLNIKRIYPIVVVTDNSFNASGVQYLIVDATASILAKYTFSTYIADPVIVDFDDILILS